jgi:hypothetical protein
MFRVFLHSLEHKPRGFRGDVGVGGEVGQLPLMAGSDRSPKGHRALDVRCPRFAIRLNAFEMAVRQGFEPWVQLLGRTTVSKPLSADAGQLANRSVPQNVQISEARPYGYYDKYEGSVPRGDNRGDNHRSPLTPTPSLRTSPACPPSSRPTRPARATGTAVSCATPVHEGTTSAPSPAPRCGRSRRRGSSVQPWPTTSNRSMADFLSNAGRA